MKALWRTYPAAPPPSHILGGLLRWGESRHIISLFYKGPRENQTYRDYKAGAAWETDLEGPMEDSDWNHACSLVKKVSCNNRFNLLHFN